MAARKLFEPPQEDALLTGPPITTKSNNAPSETESEESTISEANTDSDNDSTSTTTTIYKELREYFASAYESDAATSHGDRQETYSSSSSFCYETDFTDNSQSDASSLGLIPKDEHHELYDDLPPTYFAKK